MKQVDSFYRRKAWQQCRIQVLQRDHYLCQVCIIKGIYTPADVVHHIEHLKDRPDKALDMSNLQSVCHTCHNRLHPEKGNKRYDGSKKKKIKTSVRIIESKSNIERW
ncbi:HNH endonuclease [Seinonella peptonophila]|uniref:Putative HNH nuclease YajD n=1 Tax=Seinonella peptonophila TaxID=112248 RepID=A0A1M4ZR59_9BACL|nr:HNH endonuclease [Seinonella peptonophila]SHF20494.1 HNH endonuclease [Seinonella peptonophila]